MDPAKKIKVIDVLGSIDLEVANTIQQLNGELATGRSNNKCNCNCSHASAIQSLEGRIQKLFEIQERNNERRHLELMQKLSEIGNLNKNREEERSLEDKTNGSVQDVVQQRCTKLRKDINLRDSVHSEAAAAINSTKGCKSKDISSCINDATVHLIKPHTADKDKISGINKLIPRQSLNIKQASKSNDNILRAQILEMQRKKMEDRERKKALQSITIDLCKN